MKDIDKKDKLSHEQQGFKKSDGARFRNVCYGIAAIGATVLQYLQYFLG
jgi:hypothetical protein